MSEKSKLSGIVGFRPMDLPVGKTGINFGSMVAANLLADQLGVRYGVPAPLVGIAGAIAIKTLGKKFMGDVLAEGVTTGFLLSALMGLGIEERIMAAVLPVPVQASAPKNPTPTALVGYEVGAPVINTDRVYTELEKKIFSVI